MINIKVSGITELKQLNQLDGLGIDFAGLIFLKSSPLYIGEKAKPAEWKKTDLDIKKTGVFKDPEMIDVLDAIDQYRLDAVELHGDNSPEMCEDLGSEVEVIKAFSIAEEFDIDEMIEPYDAVCDFYLFERRGTSFDWARLKKSRIEKPFFLSGQIGPEDAKVIRSFKHPDFFGVDINEQFEKDSGVKDMVKILQFRQALK